MFRRTRIAPKRVEDALWLRAGLILTWVFRAAGGEVGARIKWKIGSGGKKFPRHFIFLHVRDSCRETRHAFRYGALKKWLRL